MKLLSLILLILFIMPASLWAANGYSCQKYLQLELPLEPSQQETSGVGYVALKPDHYKVVDLERPSEFYVEAIVVNDEVHFFLYVEAPDGTRSKTLKGRVQFAAALAHFERHGVDVDATRTNWVAATEARASRNLEEFNEALIDGATIEQAAFSTWYGQQARHHGFTVLEEIFVDDERLPGEHEHVEALFSKPQ